MKFSHIFKKLVSSVLILTFSYTQLLYAADAQQMLLDAKANFLEKDQRRGMGSAELAVSQQNQQALIDRQNLTQSLNGSTALATSGSISPGTAFSLTTQNGGILKYLGATWTLDTTNPIETTLDNSKFHLIYDNSGNLKNGFDKQTQRSFEYKNGVFSSITNFTTPIYRFYNASNGDHKYKTTKDVDPGYVIELNGDPVAYVSSSAGPNISPFYNLYNPNNQENYYTLSAGERDSLVAAGWQDKGSVGHLLNRPPDIAPLAPLYRLYNPNPGGRHHYTTSRRERDALVALGWKSEGMGDGGAAGYLTLNTASVLILEPDQQNFSNLPKKLTIYGLPQIPSITNQKTLTVDYTSDGVAKQKTFSLTEGNNSGLTISGCTRLTLLLFCPVLKFSL